MTYSSFYLYMLYGVDQNGCILVRCSYIKYVVVYNRALNLGPVLILVFPRWGVQYVKMPSCRLVGVRVEENRRRRMQTSRRRRGDNSDNNVRRIWWQQEMPRRQWWRQRLQGRGKAKEGENSCWKLCWYLPIWQLLMAVNSCFQSKGLLKNKNKKNQHVLNWIGWNHSVCMLFLIGTVGDGCWSNSGEGRCCKVEERQKDDENSCPKLGAELSI